MSHEQPSVVPSEERPASGLVCKCGSAAWRLDQRGDWRCEGGHPRRGVPGPAMQHGGRSVHQRLALIEARRADLSEDRDAILTDLGGRENVGRLKTGLAERYLETSLIAEWLGGNLLVDGVLTSKGRTRAAAMLYLQVIDRLLRLTTALGLERRPKAALSPTDYWASRCAEVEATEATTGEPQDAPLLAVDLAPDPAPNLAPTAPPAADRGDLAAIPSAEATLDAPLPANVGESYARTSEDAADALGGQVSSDDASSSPSVPLPSGDDVPMTLAQRLAANRQRSVRLWSTR